MANEKVISHSFSLEIIESLLQHGVSLNVRDRTGLSVILFAASGGHYSAKSPDLPLLNRLLDRNDITRADKIDALEMAGALILAHEENHVLFPLAFRHWRRALSLRQTETEDGPIYKRPLRYKNGELPEWRTLEDLMTIEGDPSQYEVQSVLVRLRIFSGLGFPAISKHFEPSILQFFSKETVGDQHSVSQIIDLCWLTLDTILRSERPQERGVLSTVDRIVLTLLTELLRLAKIGTQFNSENLKKAVELLMMDPWYSTNQKWERDLDLPIYGVGHLDSLHVIIKIIQSQQEDHSQVRHSLLQLIHRDYRGRRGYNVLHLVCQIVDSDFESTVRFLVQLGVNLNARTNTTGYGVFHILALRHGDDERDAAARLLLELGAHLDMVDKEGNTAADLWLHERKPVMNLWPDENVNTPTYHLPDWLQSVPKLMCFCARVIRRNKLPVDEPNLPAVLVDFVPLH